MNVLPWVIVGASALALGLLSRETAGPVAGTRYKLQAGSRYNFTLLAPGIPDQRVAAAAASALAERGHTNVVFRQAKGGGYAFNYDSFPMQKDLEIAVGAQSQLGNYDTRLLAVDTAGTPPAAYASA